ncbi:kinase-like domain-containing protein [Corynascus similis CBS 632.67]
MSSYSSADKAYDLDEPPELELDLGKLIDRASDIMKTKCTSAEKLTRGTSHEVFTLWFEEGPSAPPYLARAGFSCIARFMRRSGDTAKAVSEIATAKYLKRFTRIPVPEIYYYDLHGQDDAGAPFVIMEKMPGCHLNKIWDDLPLEGKKSVLSEIALVVAQLASLKFDQIGSLDEHGVGPLINPCLDHPMGPFQSVAEYLRSFISADSAESLLGKELLAQVENELDQFLSVSGQAAYLQPPYCLIHADFDGQNMLFVESPDGLGLKLAGLIDFEYAYTGPLYFLYEYPISIQDVSWSEEFYAENAILRAHFVRAIYDALPDSEARSTFIAALNGKNFVLSGFKNSFMTIKYSEKTLVSFSRYYIENLKDGTELAHSGRLNYISELYNEDGKPIPSEKANKTSARSDA